MPKRSKNLPLTIEQHIRIGTRLACIRDELVSLHVDIYPAKKHPTRSTKALSQIHKAYRLLDGARSNLEEVMFAQLGREGGAAIPVYYPEHNVRRAK